MAYPASARATALLRKACAGAGLDPDGARLLRIGSNAVCRLAAPVVVRISRNHASIDQARRSVAVAHWLDSVDFPAVRAADVGQPVVIDAHAVTFWEAVSDDGDQYATVPEVAGVLARLHALDAPDTLDLPPLAPFENAPHRIEENGWLDARDRAFLAGKPAQRRVIPGSGVNATALEHRRLVEVCRPQQEEVLASGCRAFGIS